MKYKIGDKVTLTNGDIMTIDQIDDISKWYRMKEDPWKCYTDEMIEGLVEEEMFIKANDIYNEEYSKGEYCHEQSFKWGFQEGYNYSHENDKLEISLKEGYQFKDEHGNVINATKIVLEKKKKEYPKTYEECCKIIHSDPNFYVDTHLYSGILESLYKLLICRDAYWKIAGEEMGLDGPWEPDWLDDNLKPCIGTASNEIIKCTSYSDNTILAFPTAEMRDKFYENFKSKIEICKEL